MSKPLINRLLLENNNKPDKQTLVVLGKDLILEWNQARSFIPWETLLKSQDIRQQARQITGLETTDSATTRVFFRKIAKNLDDKDLLLSISFESSDLKLGYSN
jgi:hypothetical protein